MKGVIFTEFMAMVDEAFSAEMTEEILQDARLASGGCYTSVGDYDHAEILALVTALSKRTGEDAAKLCHAFGCYLFGKLGAAHPEYLNDIDTAFDFLRHVHDHIHVEVRKLYPSANAPDVICEMNGDTRMTIAYKSTRPFADVAEGLIVGCITHFGDPIKLRRLETSVDRCSALFELEKVA